MKKLLISLLVCLVIGIGLVTFWDEAQAQEFGDSPDSTTSSVNPGQSPLHEPLAEEFKWFGMDVSPEVDAHYFLNKSLKGSFGGGIAVEFAQLFNNTVGVRGELVVPVNKPEGAPDKLIGLSGALKISNAINEIGGKSIIPANIQIGLSATVDFTRGLDWKEIRNPYFSLLTVGIKF